MNSKFTNQEHIIPKWFCSEASKYWIHVKGRFDILQITNGGYERGIRKGNPKGGTEKVLMNSVTNTP